MRVVALLTVRNEAQFLPRCLSHLAAQGVQACVIDNESTDETRAIAEQFARSGVVTRIVTLPYRGRFELVTQLESQERLSREIDADWFIHHDADEIMEAPSSGQTLQEAIAEVDAQGFNAINFDEFVFVPAQGEDFEDRDYVGAMRRYYFFEPFAPRLVRAWKADQLPVLSGSGGHLAEFDGRRLFPRNFVLRHYIILSASHALHKYGAERVYSDDEVTRLGWHGWRARFRPDMLKLPDPSSLKSLDASNEWDRSDPKRKHLFIDAG
jgi:glycosyltransferase involved in cell wall biosynthesis